MFSSDVDHQVLVQKDQGQHKEEHPQLPKPRSQQEDLKGRGRGRGLRQEGEGTRKGEGTHTEGQETLGLVFPCPEAFDGLPDTHDGADQFSHSLHVVDQQLPLQLLLLIQ